MAGMRGGLLLWITLGLCAATPRARAQDLAAWERARESAAA